MAGVEQTPDVSNAVPGAVAGFIFFGGVMVLISLLATPGPPGLARVPNALLVGVIWGLFGALTGALAGAFGENEPRELSTDP